jgi:hypothetical protein
MTVTTAEPEMVESAWETAVMSTVVVTLLLVPGEVGTACGAWYKPAEEIVPVVELPPAVPFTSQVTFWFEFPWTAALNWSEPKVWTDAGFGDTETLILACSVTLAEADLVVSTWETAVTLTVAGSVPLYELGAV